MRNISVFGYTVSELVAREFSVVEMNLSIIIIMLKVKYVKRLLGNIFEYILPVKDFSVKYLGKYKDQKGYHLF